MKLKIKDLISNKNPIGFVMLNAISEDKSDEIIASTGATPNDTDWLENELDIKFTVNGIEIDVRTMLANLYETVDCNVTSRAKELVSETLNEHYNALLDSIDEIKRKADEVNDIVDWNDIYNKKFHKEDVRFKD